MSTYETYYCNLTTDLTSVFPDVERYDQKKLITNWQTHSGSVYRADSVGFVSQLLKNGRELGSAQADLASVNTTDEWYFDSAADVVYFYNSANSPNEDRMEAGEDWVTLKTRKAQEAAELIRSFVPFPILPRQGVGTESASSRIWDHVIIKSNALLAVSALIAEQNPEQSKELERKAIDPENKLGLLDQLKAGEYKLWNQGEHQNQIRKVSVNAATTGDVVDWKGSPTIDWDIVKIQVQTGGTLASGSASTLTYSTWGKDNTGLKIAKIVDTQTITGGWDYAGHGVYVRFSAGVHTANDEYELEVSNLSDNPKIRNARLYR